MFRIFVPQPLALDSWLQNKTANYLNAFQLLLGISF